MSRVRMNSFEALLFSLKREAPFWPRNVPSGQALCGFAREAKLLVVTVVTVQDESRYTCTPPRFNIFNILGCPWYLVNGL